MAVKHSPNAAMGSGRPRSRATTRRSAKLWRRAVLLLILLGATAFGGVAYWLENLGLAPRLFGPYIERRASGHHPWIEGLGRWIGRTMVANDRADLTPVLGYPGWAVRQDSVPPPASGREVLVTTSERAAAALADAEPGDRIEFAPGIYRFDGHALIADRTGRAQAPIVVRAPARGSVTLEFNLLEGFHVSAPYWVFENLTIRGVCAEHDYCEHAFHVTGAGTDVVIRNNDLIDFNAHIKVNGYKGRFPDRGQVIGNQLFNTTPRKTSAPVTLIDMVAASGWRIESNLIADFVKADGDTTSYGAFAKGAGRGTRFIGNTVICEHRLRGEPGRRVGLSFGGGGTGAQVCRDRRCIVEHEDGVIAANVIASCSDEGIYLNRAARSELIHNTVLDTAGVRVRYPESTAVARGNLIDGTLGERDGGQVIDEGNRTTLLSLLFAGVHPVRSLFVDADALNLRWAAAPPRRDAVEAAPPDLCGSTRAARPAYGAFERIDACEKAAAAAAAR